MFYTYPLFLAFLLGTNASPIAHPQAVTATISPSGPSQPGCTGTYPGIFGIAVMNISISSTSTQLGRRQPSDSSQPAPTLTVGFVSQIGDGQIQGGMHTSIITPVSQTSTSTETMTPISQIGDGQIQNPTGIDPAVSERAASTVPSSDAGCAATPTPSLTSGTSTSTTTSTGEVSPDTALPSMTSTTSTTSISSQAATPSQNVSAVLSLVSCLTNSTLKLSISNGTLLDARNRTGYIASNYQFQFDGPPQAGAIYTSGWSVCDADDGSGSPTLALGGNTTFYQCLSGKFYNLYTVNWAAQCSPVQLKVTGLVQCGS
ncbi:hypothetical protein LTS07_003080 [Exophiala sideris]|uniref:Cell wall mannoprotein PIR1-like C-terminal domain-containing protein n=1 Tax=Exophiala sideris TaxID=1016849 RepID=A0ABR0JHU2_9EURO|nr:hypothetical protein LTS07_003080 [Exophiala sideris]KAK5042456.1 hypothetical protein LTR13_001303 [Exophiala sideris]KAK5065538.1 hypothetical protein LTR69_003087 [Exophiala sideris]